MFSIRRVRVQLEKENDRYTGLKSDQEKLDRELRELQGELKKSKMKSMKEQDMYNKILQVRAYC